MTCIVGLVDKGTVYIGADSAGVSGWSLTVRADAKAFRSGPYAIGFTSSFRLGQVLRYAAKLPDPPDDPDDLMRHMVVDFVDAARDSFRTSGWEQKDNGREGCGNFLVGVAGRLFEVQDDFQIKESLDPFAACGAGEEYALGALAVTSGRPRRRVERCLGVAARFSAAVCDPFVVVST